MSEDTHSEEFERLYNDPELNREKLQDEMTRYAKALAEEYELKSNVSPDNIEEYTEEFFRKNCHMAAAQIVWLAGNAESESVRGNMAKYILEAGMRNDDKNRDPVKDIIAGLMANDAKPQPANKEE